MIPYRYPSFVVVVAAAAAVLLHLPISRRRPSKKHLRLRHFQSDRGEIWQDCSSSKYVSIDEVGFSV